MRGLKSEGSSFGFYFFYDSFFIYLKNHIRSFGRMAGGGLSGRYFPFLYSVEVSKDKFCGFEGYISNTKSMLRFSFCFSSKLI